MRNSQVIHKTRLQPTHKGTDITFNSALCDVAKLMNKQVQLGDVYKQLIDAVKASRAPQRV